MGTSVVAGLLVGHDDVPVLARLVAAGVAGRRESGEGLDRAERDLARQVMEAYRDHLAAASDEASERPSELDQWASDLGSWLGTAETASRLGIGQRAVLDGIARGAFVNARRSGRRWQIAERDVSRYAENRPNRGRRAPWHSLDRQDSAETS